MAFAEDLDVFTADFGVPVSFAGAPSGLLGLFGDEGAHVFGTMLEPQSGPRFSVWVKTSALGALDIDSPITINGISYLVRDKQEVKPDAAFTELVLLPV